MTYGIDHLVLPVRELDIARARYQALGFTVAADARHPFGTENACVFFQNRTYLEPLAVADRIEMEENARKGLEFLRRYDAYRFRNGRDGFAMLALHSPDAVADLERFREAGFDGREVFAFEREAEAADGAKTTIGVRLAFLRDERAPDATLFCCQHINTEVFWAPEKTTHPNGAIGVGDVVLVEENPADFQYDLELVAHERSIRSSSLGIHADLPRGSVSIITPSAFRMIFGHEAPGSGRGFKLSAFVVEVADLGLVKDILARNGVAGEERGGRVFVAPAPGQGTVIVFEEKTA